MGGSGTRWLEELLADQGMCTVGPTNESRDNLTFTRLFKDKSLWGTLSVIEQRWKWFTALQLGYRIRRRDYRKLYKIFTSHTIEPASRKGTRAQLWAHFTGKSKPASSNHVPLLFKEPNLQLFAPMLLGFTKDFHYVHLMRNGAEMACNQNQQQLHLWGKKVHNIQGTSKRDSLTYWHKTNTTIAQVQELFPDAVHIIRYEDLKAKPEETLRKLMNALDLPFNPTAEYKTRKSATVIDMDGLGDDAHALLKDFGY